MPAAPASADRSLPLAARADLALRPIDESNGTRWVVTDPISLERYSLTPEHKLVLEALDGQRSIPEVLDAVRRVAPSVRLRSPDVQRIAFDLFDKRLVYSTRAGQGEAAAERRRVRRRRAVGRFAQSLLYVRLPGVDPSRLVGAVYPFVRPLFTTWAAWLVGLLTLAMWVWIGLRGEALVNQLPSAAAFVSPSRLALLWMLSGFAKAIHELGHAFACRRFGGRCREIGVALLVFCPSLYCDASDAASFPRRRDRLVVGIAGVYFEAILSLLAALVWTLAYPGLIRDAACCLFLVTNVATVAFNLNPLLRLDGYYLLSDLTNTPNLRSRATAAWRRGLANWLRGGTPREEPEERTRRDARLIAYAVASGVFRWGFLIAVTASLYAMGEPYGLESLGLLVGVATVVTAAIGGALQIKKSVGAQPRGLRRVPKRP